MNTATQNLKIKENQHITIKYAKIVQKDWLSKIELKSINEQIKMHMNSKNIMQNDYAQNVMNSNKEINLNGKFMKYLFPGVIVLLSVIILM